MNKTFQALLIGALVSTASAAFAGDNSIELSVVGGKQEAKFSLADSKCVLVNEVIRCVPVVVASK
jgi:hypothetical protein